MTQGGGYAEREAALLMLAAQQQHRSRSTTVSEDMAYDSADFVAPTQAEGDAERLKHENGHHSNLDARTARQARLYRHIGLDQHEPALAGGEGLWLA